MAANVYQAVAISSITATKFPTEVLTYRTFLVKSLSTLALSTEVEICSTAGHCHYSSSLSLPLILAPCTTESTRPTGKSRW